MTMRPIHQELFRNEGQMLRRALGGLRNFRDQSVTSSEEQKAELPVSFDGEAIVRPLPPTTPKTSVADLSKSWHVDELFPELFLDSESTPVESSRTETEPDEPRSIRPQQNFEAPTPEAPINAELQSSTEETASPFGGFAQENGLDFSDDENSTTKTDDNIEDVFNAYHWE